MKTIKISNMKTEKENYNTVVNELIDGFVVADSHGNEWLTSDLDDVEEYVWCNNNSRRVDWPITDLTISQGTLDVPGEDGNPHTILCRYSMNEDCLTPYVADDFCYNEGGFVQNKNN